MPEVPKTIPVGGREDPFVIEEIIGEGGMGKVYRAHDPVSGERLAVKVLGEVGDPTRFALESDILSKLRHPNIVAYRAHGLTQAGQPYLAMEWIDGDDLEVELGRHNLSVEETLRVARAVADALATAHAAGVIHRDLKPSNVILTRTDRTVKLVDFGIARAANVEGLTKTGQALGTPGYMSPEQARGMVVDTRTDLFSLGCLLFRCLGGRRPFAGSDIMQFATSLATETPPLLRELAPATPPELEALVARLLQKDPALRPESALHVRQGIDRIILASDKTDLAPTAAAPAMPTPIVVPTKRSPTEMPLGRRSAVFGVIGLVAVIGVYVVGSGSRIVSPPAPVATASASTSTTAAPIATAPPPDHSALERACRDWSGAIGRAQKPDGSFAGEDRLESSGWDTAQQLFALTEAFRVCEGVSVAQVALGARALDKLHVDGGWLGPRKGPLSRADRVAETPAIAWAVLALKAANDPAALARAKSDLAKARNPDGGFREHVAGEAPSGVYATALAAWALDDAAAKAWLVAAVDANAPGTREPGFSEELAFVLRRGPAATKRILAAEIIAHCRPDAGGACARAAYDSGRIPLEADAGHGGLVAPWHPWATLAAATYARDPDLDAATRGQLAGIARWGVKELTASIDVLGAAPEYKLAEYLIAVAELLTHD